jgi:heme oxygenase
LADPLFLDGGVPIERLREATLGLHRQLEDDLDVVAQLSSEPGRGAMLARYHDFYAGGDAILGVWVGGKPDFDGFLHARANRLRDDLRTRRVTATAPSPRPPIENYNEALGFLYVIEGSALGGRLILRQLAARHIEVTGLGFLDPHGDQAGAFWRRLLKVLDRELSGDDLGVQWAVGGAVKGFNFARACLLAPAMMA